MGLMGYPEFLWIFVGFFRFFEVLKDILAHIGYILVLMGICGFPLIVGSPRFLWGILGSLGFLKFLRTFLVISVTFGF